MRSEAAAAWREEAASFTRSFSGAALFGVPLLFTMEMWWIGTYADLWKLLLFLGLTFRWRDDGSRSHPPRPVRGNAAAELRAPGGAVGGGC